MVVHFLTSPFLVVGEKRLAGDLCCPFEAASAEVARWQTSHFVDDVHEHCGTVGIEGTLWLGDCVRE